MIEVLRLRLGFSNRCRILFRQHGEEGSYQVEKAEGMSPYSLKGCQGRGKEYSAVFGDTANQDSKIMAEFRRQWGWI